MGALRSKYATDSWQMLHVTRGTSCHYWGQLGITGPLSDSPVSNVRITMGQNVAWYGTPPETWTSLMCWWRWNMEKDIYIYTYWIRILKIQVFFLSIHAAYTCIHNLCDSKSDSHVLKSLHRGCRLPWSTALFHRWPGAFDRTGNTNGYQWFSGFRQQGPKGNRFESTQIQFI